VKPHVDDCWRWLSDKPVKPEFRARVAALMSAKMMLDGVEATQAMNHWRKTRPDFFEDTTC